MEQRQMGHQHGIRKGKPRQKKRTLQLKAEINMVVIKVPTGIWELPEPPEPLVPVTCSQIKMHWIVLWPRLSLNPSLSLSSLPLRKSCSCA